MPSKRRHATRAELVSLSACETGLGQKGGGDGLLGFAQAFLTAGARSVCLSLWKVDDTATALLMSRFYENLLGKRPGLDKPMAKAEALAEAKVWLRTLTFEQAADFVAKLPRDLSPKRGKNELLNIIEQKDAARPSTDQKNMDPFADPRFWAAFVLLGDPA